MSTVQVDAPVAALQRAGFVIKPWEPADEIAAIMGKPCRDLRTFDRGTICGLVEILPDALNVIALMNAKPHNGQFEKAVRKLESTADELEVTMRVVQFWNDRLQRWFARRGYQCGHHPSWGDYAERIKQKP